LEPEKHFFALGAIGEWLFLAGSQPDRPHSVLLFPFSRRNWRRIPPPQQIIEKRPRHHRQLPPGRIDRVPVAQDGKSLDVEFGELAGLVEREGMAGEGGDAVEELKGSGSII